MIAQYTRPRTEIQQRLEVNPYVLRDRITATIRRTSNNPIPGISRTRNDVRGAHATTGFEQVMEKQARKIDKMLLDKTREDMYLFTNATPYTEPEVYIPNRSLWCERLRSQLVGAQMYCSGGWWSSYALTPITPRHAVGCAHGGPQGNANLLARYVNADGEIWDTHITQWITDNYNQRNKDSDVQQTLEADLSVYRFADDFPDWMPLEKVIILDAAQTQTLYDIDYPMITVSQGSPPPSYEGNDLAWPAHGRRVYVHNIDCGLYATQSLRYRFLHTPTIGDSGSHVRLFFKNQLYAYRCVTNGDTNGAVYGEHVDYINSMIARADVVAGATEGYQLQTVPLDSLL